MGSSGRLVLTVADAARLLGISRGLAYEAVRVGQIPSVRIGRRILIPRRALEEQLGLESGPAATKRTESEPASSVDQ